MERGTPMLLLLLILVAGCVAAAAEELHRKTFRSPGFVQGPGDVVDEFYTVEMPEGHVAIRSFDAQVVDGDGTPIPLHETYLHHWILVRYLEREGRRRAIRVPNAGVCRKSLPQMFGLGSETRRTNTTVPPPYGIEAGDPASVPRGFRELWMLNVHAIDTRGAVDARGCTECLCELYDAPRRGWPLLPPGYEGGLECCQHGQHCAVRPEFQQAGATADGDGSSSSSSRRTLFVEYTVTWVEMSDEVVPVMVYVLDVTDQRTAMILDEDEDHECQVEYTVDKCAEGALECIHTAETDVFFPNGGELIYAVGHQHSGGLGCTLHSEDGGEICSSLPIYGDGTAAGNEEGYIVGMTTCYPEPGSVNLRAGEKLHFRSFYNNEVRHTGVMGLFYLLVNGPPSPPRKRDFLTNEILVAVTVIAAVCFIITTIALLMNPSRLRGQGTEVN